VGQARPGRTEERTEGVEGEVAVLEVAEHPEVERDAQGQEKPSAPVPLVHPIHGQCHCVVHERRGGDDEGVVVVPVAVEDVVGDEEHREARAAGKRVPEDEGHREQHEVLEADEAHASGGRRSVSDRTPSHGTPSKGRTRSASAAEESVAVRGGGCSALQELLHGTESIMSQTSHLPKELLLGNTEALAAFGAKKQCGWNTNTRSCRAPETC
jgi:hypothetical protein